MKKNNFGFTLIEVLAVVLMIGILTVIGLPQYRRSVQRAEAMEVMVNLKTIYEAAKRYRAANSKAPLSLKGLDVQFFDAEERGDSVFIGNYRYKFYNDHISACRVDGKGNSTYSDTYCLTIYYKYNKTATSPTYRDLMLCNSSSEKWKYVCESLAQTCSNGDTAKSNYSYYISDKVVCE